MIKRRSFLIGAGSLLASPSIVRAIGGGSSTDPYIMPTLPGYNPGWQAYGARTQVAVSSLTGGIGCILAFGDSVGSNVVNATYTPVQAKNYNFNVYNGGLYATKEPLLGGNFNAATSGSIWSQAGDNLLTNVSWNAIYTNYVIAPIMLGGSLLTDYASGGALNGAFAPSKLRLDAAGLTVTGIHCLLGANDTNAGTSQVSATASITSIVSTLRALWPTTPIFVATHSLFNLVTNAGIQAALQSVWSAGNKVYDGGNFDSLTAAGNYWDNTHPNATGRAAMATLLSNAIAAHP
jgi:hypothetical protein